MSPAARLARAAWLRTWRAAQRYHRYTVDGFEHLAEGPAALIVGYHGRPIAGDLCMLSVYVHDRLGYLPRAIFHRAFEASPLLRPVLEGTGGVVGDHASLAAAVAKGEHLVVTPGGTREGCRSARDRYRVDWGRRTGYLRLALRLGVDLVPVAAAGNDDTYLGLNDGDAWGRRVGLPAGLPLWLGVGPLGLWPLSPPFPVRIRQVIGPRIPLPAVDARDHEALGRLHAEVTDTVQGLMDRARAAIVA